MHRYVSMDLEIFFSQLAKFEVRCLSRGFNDNLSLVLYKEMK